VQHILASTSAGGTTVVWDLKRQKQVISFTDPNGARRCSALAWNPEVATQLITCSDDDRSPVLQVWDLRNSISPAREFSGHSKGVLAMAWCAQDPQLLLTCGKDNRTLCWDAPSGEVVA
jgi:protein transport protein SEC31